METVDMRQYVVYEPLPPVNPEDGHSAVPRVYVEPLIVRAFRSMTAGILVASFDGLLRTGNHTDEAVPKYQLIPSDCSPTARKDYERAVRKLTQKRILIPVYMGRVDYWQLDVRALCRFIDSKKLQKSPYQHIRYK